jgi:hypothetical protein
MTHWFYYFRIYIFAVVINIALCLINLDKLPFAEVKNFVLNPTSLDCVLEGLSRTL